MYFQNFPPIGNLKNPNIVKIITKYMHQLFFKFFLVNIRLMMTPKAETSSQ